MDNEIDPVETSNERVEQSVVGRPTAKASQRLLLLEFGLGLSLMLLLCSFFGVGFLVATAFKPLESATPTTGELPDRGDAEDGAADPLPAGTSVVISADKESGTVDVLLEPSAESPRVTQAFLQDEAQILEERPGWRRVKLKDYELSGWVRQSEVVEPPPPKSSAGLWFVILQAPGVHVPKGPFLPYGAKLPYAGSGEKGPELLLPSGKTVSLDGSQVSAWHHPVGLETALRTVQKLRESSYQDGGNSYRSGFDAAGLIFLFCRSMGVVVPRDLAGLREAGKQVSEEEMRPGDVILLSTFNPDQQPQPVLLLDADGRYLQASPATGVALAELGRRGNREIVEVRRYLNESTPQ